MTVEAVCPPGSAQFIGLVFVERYYNNFYQFPQDAYKFYLDSSELSRPGPDGLMTSFTTLQGIKEGLNDTITSSKNFKVQIYTSDAQFSYNKGVIVLVTGCLTGNDSIKRKFTQTFFLAPQDKGYFVLNDVFRYIDDKDSLTVDSVIPNGDHQAVPSTPLAMEPEPDLVAEQPHVEVATEKVEENSDLLVNENEAPVVSVKEATPVAVQSIPRENGIVSSVSDCSSPDNSRVTSPKKSYASMLMKLKNTNNTAVTAPIHSPLPSPSAARPEPIKSEQKLSEPPASEASTHSNNGTPRSSNGRPEAKNFCIVIRNLPLSTKFNHVDQIFKKYGTIRQGSIQVRSYLKDKSAFAFVDFENAADMEKAIKASPIVVEGGRELTVEQKKPYFRGRDKNQAKGNGNGNGSRNEPGRERGGGSRSNGRNGTSDRERENKGKPRAIVKIDADGFQLVEKPGRQSLQRQS